MFVGANRHGIWECAQSIAQRQGHTFDLKPKPLVLPVPQKINAAVLQFDLWTPLEALEIGPRIGLQTASNPAVSQLRVDTGPPGRCVDEGPSSGGLAASAGCKGNLTAGSAKPVIAPVLGQCSVKPDSTSAKNRL